MTYGIKTYKRHAALENYITLIINWYLCQFNNFMQYIIGSRQAGTYYIKPCELLFQRINIHTFDTSGRDRFRCSFKLRKVESFLSIRVAVSTHSTLVYDYFLREQKKNAKLKLSNTVRLRLTKDQKNVCCYYIIHAKVK